MFSEFAYFKKTWRYIEVSVSIKIEVSRKLFSHSTLEKTTTIPENVAIGED